MYHLQKLTLHLEVPLYVFFCMVSKNDEVYQLWQEYLNISGHEFKDKNNMARYIE